MIVAWEAVGLVPKIDEGTEITVRAVRLDSPQDALGRNIVGVVHVSDYADVHLVEEIRRRVRATVGQVAFP